VKAFARPLQRLVPDYSGPELLLRLLQLRIFRSGVFLRVEKVAASGELPSPAFRKNGERPALSGVEGVGAPANAPELGAILGGFALIQSMLVAFFAIRAAPLTAPEQPHSSQKMA
jgi:hypothetical protein